MKEESVRLRLGFDAKRLFNNRTGLGNYSRVFISELSRYYPGNEYHLYSPAAERENLPADLLEKKNVFVHGNRAGFSAYWRSFGIKNELLRHDVQLYHGLSNEIPVGLRGTGIRSVVTIHDLIFKRYPSFFPLIDRQIYDLKSRYACRNADKIIALSRSTARDIIHYYKTDESKVEVIYQACDKRFETVLAKEEIQTIKARLSLPEEYMLYVGSVIPRKNLLLILRAMLLLKGPDRLPLVVAGTGKKYLEKAKAFVAEHTALEGLVFFKDDIGNDELPAVYQGASLFIYPSWYEGFGLPIREALLSGLPVIAANTSSLPEAGGPDSMYVRPDKPEELAEMIRNILHDAALRKKMIECGKAFAHKAQKVNGIDAAHHLYEKILIK